VKFGGRRAAARVIDFVIWLVCWDSLALLFFGGWRGRTLGVFLVDQFFAACLASVSEALCIARWGTTVGKRLAGLSVVRKGRTALTYRESFRRAFDIWRYGFGCGIPYYRLVCLARFCYSARSGRAFFPEHEEHVQLRKSKRERWGRRGSAAFKMTRRADKGYHRIKDSDR